MMIVLLHYQDKLREDLSEKVRWNINRDSMEDKQRALLDLMPALKSDINHQVKSKELFLFCIHERE